MGKRTWPFEWWFSNIGYGFFRWASFAAYYAIGLKLGNLPNWEQGELVSNWPDFYPNNPTFNGVIPNQAIGFWGIPIYGATKPIVG